jgi:hypothetical protein
VQPFENKEDIKISFLKHWQKIFYGIQASIPNPILLVNFKIYIYLTTTIENMKVY